MEHLVLVGFTLIQFAYAFCPRCNLLLNSLLCGLCRDEALYSFTALLVRGSSLARTLIFWILSFDNLRLNLVNKHFARGFYQVLCIVFGNILVCIYVFTFILNLQITSDYINQVLVYNFTQLAVEKNDFLLTLAYQSFAVLGSGLLLVHLLNNHLLG